VIAVRGGQGQEAIPNSPFDRGCRRSRGELVVAELSARLEPRVDEGAVDRHHLQRADDLVSGAELRPALAGDSRQPEQVVGWVRAREEVPAQRHHVAVAEDTTLFDTVTADADERACGGGLPHGTMLSGLHRDAPTRVHAARRPSAAR
jgi:hypothetical protein